MLSIYIIERKKMLLYHQSMENQTKIVDVEMLLKSYSSYLEGANAIQKKVAQNELSPIKSSKTNGKNPPLYQRYRILSSKKEKDYRSLLELAETFPINFEKSWYLGHMAQFEKDAFIIEGLIAYLEKDPDLSIMVSENERSFEIWHQEKLFSQRGKRVLEHLGLPENFLNTYATHEPICFFSATHHLGQILIVENLDPFVACRTLLERKQQNGTIVYGAGKKIIRQMEDLEKTKIEFLKASLDQIEYLGDLDWEGIAIYDSLCKKYPTLSIPLCVKGYRKMLKKAHSILESLPLSKEGQIPQEDSTFFSQFSKEEAQEIKGILKAGKYIPQEILTSHDYETLWPS